MTHDLDLDRLLDAWFADGPAEAPDRVLDDMAARIDRQPQRPAWRLRHLEAPMNASLKLLLVAAAALAAGAIGLTILGGGADTVDRTSPAPPSAVASAAAASPASPASTPAVAYDCADATVACGGILEPGTHASTVFSVPFTFETPEGWENTKDIPRTYALETNAGSAWPLQVLGMNALADQAACGPVARSDPGSTVEDFVDAVRSHPGLVSTEPVPVEVGGFAGQTVDFSVAGSWTEMCPDLDPIAPVALLLTDTGNPPGRAIAYNSENRVRWTVLDVGGEIVIIELVGPPSESQFASAVAADQPIIDSIRFTAGD